MDPRLDFGAASVSLWVVVIPVLVLGGLIALIVWLAVRRPGRDEVDEPRRPR